MNGVRVNYGSPKPAALQAAAYAQGSAIHLGPGSREHLPHEAWHVVQQRQGRVRPTLRVAGHPTNDAPELEHEADVMGRRAATLGVHERRKPAVGRQEHAAQDADQDPIQRLQKNIHPWRGVITGAPTVPLADARKKKIADLPQGHGVNVIARAGSLNRIRHGPKKSPVIGYVQEANVDDASAHNLDAMIAAGAKATWTQSGPGSGNDFETWASAAAEGAAPPVAQVTTINCWEMVLLAAFRSGSTDWKFIHDLYVKVPYADWVSGKVVDKLIRGARKTYDVNDPKTPKPNRGDMVFFDDMEHVSLATGAADGVFTFWPPPNTAFGGKAGTLDDVKTSTITILSNWMLANSHPPAAPVVTFAQSSW